jgi:RNA polymerase sigma factor for flagellar operon FliA
VSALAYQQVRADAQRDELILGHLPLVRHILGRLAARLPYGVDLENLEAAGTLGLVEAATRFEPERGIHFKTFAYTRIRGAIYDELRRNCPLPQELLERVAQVRQALQSLPPPVRVEALARGTGLNEDDINECLAAMRMTRVVSWNDIAEPTDDANANPAGTPEQRLENAERRRLLAEAIKTLPDAERLAITLYYMEDLRLKEIGCVLNLSESRVCRLLKSAELRLEEFVRQRESADETAA